MHGDDYGTLGVVISDPNVPRCGIASFSTLRFGLEYQHLISFKVLTCECTDCGNFLRLSITLHVHFSYSHLDPDALHKFNFVGAAPSTTSIWHSLRFPGFVIRCSYSRVNTIGTFRCRTTRLRGIQRLLLPKSPVSMADPHASE